MLVIRMQRTGRKGYAQFRVVVQDSRRTPTSGRVVALLGNLNPHTKQAIINKEKAVFYMEHGAQPSDRVVQLFQAEGIKLPEWVKAATIKKREIRNSEKLRKNRPAEPEKETSSDQSANESEEVKSDTVEIEAEDQSTDTPASKPE